MLRLISAARSALSNVAESVAPLLRNKLETLQFAWKKIDEEYARLVEHKDLDDPAVLHNSRLPEYLNLLVQAVILEDQEQKRGEVAADTVETGPCFEFLLQHNAIDRLCALGLPDRPPGMRPLITRTLDVIFLNVEKPLLPNMSVHMAVRQFITVCVKKGDMQRKSAKHGFLLLLRTLCLKLREDPSLAWVFFDETLREQNESSFLLFTALLSLMNDFDDDGSIAIEGILCCVQLPDSKISQYIVESTNFVAKLVDGLSLLYSQLPLVLQAESEVLPTSDVRFATFFARLALVDVVCASTYSIMRDRVRSVFLTEFLQGVVRPQLLHMEEAVARCTTVYIRRMVERLECVELQETFAEFLLGDLNVTTLERPEDAKLLPVRSTVIRRIDSLSEDLSIATLGLFDTLLGTRSPKVMQNLVLRNFRSLRHIKHEHRSKVSEHLAQCAREGTLASVDVENLVSLFEGTEFLLHDSTVEAYLVDAQAEAQLWMLAFGMGTVPPSPSKGHHRGGSTTTDAADGDGEEWFEGLFLATLLAKLEGMHEQSFATNLRLTSVLSRIAYCPHPVLHEYFFDIDATRYRDGVRLIILTLAKVWTEGYRRLTQMPNGLKRLEAAQKRLSGSSDVGTGVETMENEKFLESMVVLQEFLKELLAVGNMKYNLLEMTNMWWNDQSASEVDPERDAGARSVTADAK